MSSWRPERKQVGRRLSTPTEWPFIAINEANPGARSTSPAIIGQAYFIAPYHYQGRLISNAVRWAAKESPPPFEVEAPLAVQAAFYTQNDGKRHIVHLLNELNSTANRALPINNPSMRMEVIPIYDDQDHDQRVQAKQGLPRARQRTAQDHAGRQRRGSDRAEDFGHTRWSFLSRPSSRADDKKGL